ncbi:MAG: CBS domain-containing protein [Nitrososphaerota archaeon]|nr:CBS domain-containing protein [Nitrososphaerota archaeon]
MKSTPAVDRRSPLIYAASLLRFHSVEAAMVLVEDMKPLKMGNKTAFVGGYSILTTLQKAEPKEGYKVLFGPSERSAIWMTSLKAEQSIRDLLLAFQEGRFGFTSVTSEGMFAMVGLSDMLGLYEAGAIGSDLTVREVASKVVEVDKHTRVREALRLMLERRIRRVFIHGTKAFLSDRELVSNIFSPRKLKEAKQTPSAILEGTVLEAGPVEPIEVDGGLPLKEAAKLVVRTQGGAILCEEGVVSPWDVVMKPFATGHLNVR